jgi:DNA-binding NtrC family response regulator
VNCGALRADLALSQLFGHRKGAFTGAHAEGIGLVEAAHGGTLFLDEVGELPADVQVTLLRFLESGEYLRLGDTQVRRADVRVIAATNRELRGRGAEQLFRRDLLFRLNEIEIRVPALAERAADILPLARHFLAFYGGIDGPRLVPDAEGLLNAYPWPGNVRELANTLERAVALAEHDVLLTEDVSPAVTASCDPNDLDALARRGASLAEVEAAYVRKVLDLADLNKARAARVLGIDRRTIYRKLEGSQD